MSAPAALLLAALAAAPNGAGRDAQGEQLQGFLVAANATEVLAPEFSFRVGGWNSNWGNCKLLELAADGQEVKQGDVVARFEFIGRDALNWVNERLQRAQAEESEGRIAADQAVEALAMEQRRKEIEVRLAGIAVEKERALSKQQAAVNRVAQRLSTFEVDAAAQRLAARQRTREAERAFLERTVGQRRAERARYDFYERRFTLLAPHAGVVRHAFNPRERRKVKKGDGMQSGLKVLSVARDATLAVRFFVPEHELGKVAVGTRVLVASTTSAEELPATVSSIGFFPQELGYLLENEELPNGRERAFEVKAELEAPPKGLTAGTEVRVRVMR